MNEERRISPRDSNEEAVFINDNPFGNFSTAVIYNISRDGLYFETSCSIQDGQDVYVKFYNEATRVADGEVQREYQAKVKWCREISSDENKPCFGLGLHIINEEHIDSIESSAECSTNCDKCGVILSGKISKTEDLPTLCKKCYDHFKTFPDGELKSCIENYLMGNVL